MNENKVAREFQLNHEQLVRNLSERGFDTQWQDIPKPSGIKRGLVVHIKGANVAPVYYPDEILKDMDKQPENLNEFVNYFIQLHTDCRNSIAYQEMGKQLLDRDYLLSHVMPCLMNESCAVNGITCPCELQGIKAALFVTIGGQQVFVNKTILNVLSISERAIWEAAMQNNRKNREMIEINGPYKGYALTKGAEGDGAAALLDHYEDERIYLDHQMLQMLAKRCSTVFGVLLPAGTDCIFYLPYRKGDSMKSLLESLYHANRMGMTLGEVLSDELSIYDASADRILSLEEWSRCSS